MFNWRGSLTFGWGAAVNKLHREAEASSYGELMARLVRLGFRKVGEKPDEDFEFWFNAAGRGDFRWVALFSVRSLTGRPGWAILAYRHDPRPG